jgi:flagellar protein FliS
VLNPYQQYATNQINTASPEELTLMLFKGAIKFISLAIKSIDDKSLEEANTNIIKAQNIFYELLTTLDRRYPISQSMASLYDFIIKLLVDANVRKDKEMLQQALVFAREFAETWEQAIKIYRCSHGVRKAE